MIADPTPTPEQPRTVAKHRDDHEPARPFRNGPLGYECARCGRAVSILSRPEQDEAVRLRGAIERALDAHSENRCEETDAVLETALATPPPAAPPALDVERLAKALYRIPTTVDQDDVQMPQWRAVASKIAVEYASLSPERDQDR